MKVAVVKFSIKNDKIMDIIGIVDDGQIDSMDFISRERYDNILAMCNVSECKSLDEFILYTEKCKIICKDDEYATMYISKKFSVYRDLELYKLCRSSFCDSIKNGEGCRYDLIACSTPIINDEILKLLRDLI